MRYYMINGVDILPLIKEDGIKVSRNDVDGKNAGRVIGNAKMVRDREAIKQRHDISLRELNTAEAKMIYNLILPVFVTVQYDMWDGNVSKVMYSNNATAVVSAVFGNDDDAYKEITFPLIEQ